MMSGSRQTLRMLAGWLGIVALVELLLLRTGTRTLIHIPGLGQFDTSIGILNESGRFAYYLAAVLLISILIYLSRILWQAGTRTSKVISGLLGLFLAVVLAGRTGLITSTAVGWFSLLMLIALLVSTWSGVKSIPRALFVAAWALVAWVVIGQELGGGLSGQSVDILVIAGEGLLLLAGVTAPLLVSARPTTASLVAGFGAFLAVAAGFSFGGSTLSILTLWNLGVPGWFSPIAYGLAFGGLVVAVWTALTSKESLAAAAIALLVAGGVGTISTYQTALVFTSVLLLGVTSSRPDLSRSTQPDDPAPLCWPGRPNVPGLGQRPSPPPSHQSGDNASQGAGGN